MKTRLNCPDFSLSQTLECGQCFRFQKKNEDVYTVIAGSKVNTFEQVNDSILFYDDSDIAFWRRYFDMDRDYVSMQKILMKDDKVMAQAVSFAPGIHILRQEFFETLISFIISQNNHIPRIRGLIQKLSEQYGQELEEDIFAFPSAQALRHVTEADLRQMGCGFRARYIVDAVEKVLTGEYEQAELMKMPVDELRQKLMEICGVGQKVADCVMLFSLEKHEVFPADVWIGRIMSEAYFKGADVKPKMIQEEAQRRFSDYAGFAQQYLFHYGRMMKIGKGDKK